MTAEVAGARLQPGKGGLDFIKNLKDSPLKVFTRRVVSLHLER